jgi:hypothetical protein
VLIKHVEGIISLESPFHGDNHKGELSNAYELDRERPQGSIVGGIDPGGDRLERIGRRRVGATRVHTKLRNVNRIHGDAD